MNELLLYTASLQGDSSITENAFWSAIGLAAGYLGGRLHCWLVKVERKEDRGERA